MGKLLGVLGGMGPMAAADFFKKLIEETPAQRDQDHVPVIVYSVPQIPSRDKALTRNGESPLPQMLAGLRILQQANVQCVAIPCNTAHFWYDELRSGGGLPILHIVDAVCDEMTSRGRGTDSVGLLCTEATLASRIYHDRLLKHGIEPMINLPQERDEFINPAIDLVKMGRLEEAGRAVECAVARLFERGVQTLVLGCTEIPVALEAVRFPDMDKCIDATRALARASVAWSLGSSDRVRAA
jgi:aspartate racemase